MKKKKVHKKPTDSNHGILDYTSIDIVQIYNSVPIPIAIYDSTDKSITLNKKFTELFGYTDLDIKKIDDWWRLCVQDANIRNILKAEWTKRISDTIKNNSTFEPMEMEIQCKNGSKKYIRYNPEIIDNYYVGFFVDISDWKEIMEEKLLVSERRTQSLLYAPKTIPMAIFDRDGTILEINDAAVRETRLTAKKLIGKNIFTLLQKYGVEDVYRFKEVIENKKAINFKTKFLNSTYDIEYYPLLNKDEEVEKVALYARNLSDIFLKEKLFESETRFKTFMEHGPFRAYIKNKKGEYIYGNPAALNFIKNFNNKDFVGSKVEDYFNTKTAEEMHTFDQQILKTMQPITIEPHPHTDKSGKTSYMKEIKFPLRVSQDEVLIGGIVLDVTEEVLLQQNLLLTQFSVENSGIGIVWTNDKAKFVYANTYACNAFGYSKEEFLELYVWEITPEYTKTRSFDLINQMGPNGIVTDETIARRKDGTEFPIYVNINNLDINGKNYMFGYFFDLSERKQKENQLQLSQFSMDNSSIPIMIFTDDGSMTYSNNIASTTLGFEKYEMPLLNAWEMIPALSTQSVVNELISELKTKKRIIQEAEIKKKDGSTFTALVTTNLLELADTIYFVVYLQDITLQKLQKMELNKLFNATEQSPISVVITDTQGMIDYVNPKFCSLTGYTVDELIGKNPRILKTGYTTIEEYKNLWNTINNGEVWQGTFRNVKKNGDFFWENATISPIFGTDGKIQYFLGLKEDITEKITLQEQLQHSQKMEAMGRLAGSISHDFNNILTVIMGTAQLLQHDMIDESTRESLSEIIKASNRAASLTRQLLAFSKKQVLKPKLVDLNRVLQEMENMIRRILPENIQLEILPYPQTITIKVDKAQLEQVILNLVINAKEAMLSGGKLTIATSVNSKHLGNQLNYFGSLSINDTGIGMDEQTQSHLFEPFFTTKPKGTGLGLATVYGIVSQSNGQIEVETSIGEGSKFVIHFPLKLNAIAGEDDFIPKKNEWRGTETILLIEDEEAVRKVLYQILTNEGYTVWQAENGESALLNYSHLVNKIDLIVSDVIMPVMGGVEAISKFHEISPNLKTLFISGYAGEENPISKDGFFVTKPINRVEFLKKMREILD